LDAPALDSFAVDGKRLTQERLPDEVGHHPAVVFSHPGPVGVEDPHYTGVHFVVAAVGHGESLGVALGLIIDAPDTDGVDVAPVSLWLGCTSGSP
jgi:hypothetical protein